MESVGEADLRKQAEEAEVQAQTPQQSLKAAQRIAIESDDEMAGMVADAEEPDALPSETPVNGAARKAMDIVVEIQVRTSSLAP